jgi:Kef-type K+ transport system membrane component KefB
MAMAGTNEADNRDHRAQMRAESRLPTRRLALTYAVLVGAPIVGLIAILQLGRGLTAHGSAAGGTLSSPAAATTLNLPLLLAQIIVIVVAARLTGRIVSRFGQPRVIGEMLAGILLGPSVLGAGLPSVSAALFPAPSLGFLSVPSQIGLLFFMFLVGLGIDPAHLRERGQTAVVASHASIAAPFLMGATLSLLIYPLLAPAGVEFAGFALFVGAAMSVTAFPVLARILSELQLTRTRLGTLAVACAAVDDVSAWCILAAVVVLSKRSEAEIPVWATIAGTLIFVVFMVTVGKRLLKALIDRYGRLSLGPDMMAVILVSVLLSAWITERIGIHALFGAFLLGAIMPRDERLIAGLKGQLETVMVVLLLPLFFAFTGLRTRIDLISGSSMWMLCGLVTLVAIAGKIGGAALAAKVTGLEWRESLALGALLNTRGLMELVILNIGLDVGVISPTLFTMMVLMAVVTTTMTTPLIRWLHPAVKVEPRQVRRAS